MKYLSVVEFASLHGISERTVRNYCASGKLEGSFLIGKTWNIPVDATLPIKGKHIRKASPLLQALRLEKENM
ncbi:MAG: cell filamentation protein Fic, partial [Bacteroidales bacterium]|nr:cell filamentation protein Fic [Bacteroidales bacterium]